MVRAGHIVAAPTFLLLLNFDRRLLAGGPAARFFHRIVETLEHAETELAEPETPAKRVEPYRQPDAAREAAAVPA